MAQEISAAQTLFYDWGEYDFSAKTHLKLLDTSNRDGEQSADIRHPNIDEKIKLAHKLYNLGVTSFDLGMPVAGGTHLEHAITIAKTLPPDVEIMCLARTHPKDISAVLEFRRRIGREVIPIVFVGSSMMREHLEQWSFPDMVRMMRESVKFAVSQKLTVNVATEHTTQTSPDRIKDLYRAGLDEGGTQISIADTAGKATPRSTWRLLEFFKAEVLAGYSITDIDWHGHNDRVGAVICSMEAAEAGATRIHGTARGVGERSGNTCLGLIMGNLWLAGFPRVNNLEASFEAVSYAAQIYDLPIPSDYPIFGSKVNKTESGIHARVYSAAEKWGFPGDIAYTSIPSDIIGRQAEVTVGPMSGSSNVEWVAKRLGITDITPEFVNEVLKHAKVQNKSLATDDIMNIYRNSGVQQETNGHS